MGEGTEGKGGDSPGLYISRRQNGGRISSGSDGDQRQRWEFRSRGRWKRGMRRWKEKGAEMKIFVSS